MPEPTAPIPEDEADGSEGAQASICIPRASITIAELRELRVRVYSSDTWDDIEVYLISRTGLAKLVRAGWTMVGETPSRTVAGLVHAVIQRRSAGQPAVAPVTRKEQVMCVTAGGAWGGPEDFQRHLRSRVQDDLVDNGSLRTRPVDIIDGRGRVIEPSHDQSAPFRILIGATGSEGVGPAFAGERQWGLRAVEACRHRGGLADWEGGIPIVTEEGEEVAAVDGNNLYIYQALSSRTESSPLEIFGRILRLARDIIPTAGEGQRSAKDAYVTLCGQRMRILRQQSSAKINALLKAISDHQKELISAIRECRREQATALALDQVESADGQKYAAEYDALLRTPGVAAVIFRGDRLKVTTSDIAIVDPRTGKNHDIGAFRIEIHAATGLARFTNLTRRVAGYESEMHHPHVFPRGNACLGSLSGSLPPLIAAYEFSAAIQLCLAFLNSVNVDDPAGSKIDRWPVVGTAAAARPAAPAPSAVVHTAFVAAF